MGEAREYNKRNKSVRERHIPYDFSYMWNLRNKTKEPMEKRHTQREKPRNRLIIIENKVMFTREEVGGEMG